MESSTFVHQSESDLGFVPPNFAPVEELDAAIKSSSEKPKKKNFWENLSKTLDTINEGAETVKEIIDTEKGTSAPKQPVPQKPAGTNNLRIAGMAAAGVLGVIMMAKILTPNKKS